jgi:hypothetical protein
MVAQGLGDLWAFYGLPLPTQDGYGYKSAFQLQRTTMSSGFTRQRRKWSAGYRQLDATFELHVDQLPVLRDFFDNYGYDWFSMSLVTGELGAPQEVSLYIALDRSGSMHIDVSPGVTRIDVVVAAIVAALRILEPRIASGDLILNLLVSAFSQRGGQTRKWAGYGVSTLSLADLYDWFEYITDNTLPPPSPHRSSVVDLPVPQEILDELDALGLPLNYSTSIWAGVTGADAFFSGAPSAERVAMIVADGGFGPPSEMPAALAELNAVPGLRTHSFLVGLNTPAVRYNMTFLDSTPEDGVPFIAWGDYDAMLSVITKALPVRSGAFVKTVRVMADPQFSNLRSDYIQVALKLEVQ